MLVLGALWLLFAPGCKQEETTPALQSHLETYPEIRKKYVYQSLIRLANVKRDPEFEKLIKDVEKVVLYFPPEGDSTYQIKSLQTSIQKDGYEQLLDVRTAQADRISLWVRESGDRSYFMALLDSQTEDLIMEIDGQLDLEYISSFKVADEESLTGLLKGSF